MKKIFSIACLAGILFFAACENKNSSTVGTYEYDETPQSSDKKEDNPEEKNAQNNKTETVKDATIDTSKNISAASKDSLAAKSKIHLKNIKVEETKKSQAKP